MNHSLDDPTPQYTSLISIPSFLMNLYIGSKNKKASLDR